MNLAELKLSEVQSISYLLDKRNEKMNELIHELKITSDLDEGKEEIFKSVNEILSINGKINLLEDCIIFNKLEETFVEE